MLDEKKNIPEEIRKFHISKRSFKNLVESKVGENIKSINLEGDRTKMTISKPLLFKIVGEIYNENIETIDFNGEGADIVISKPTKTCENQKKSNKKVKQKTGGFGNWLNDLFRGKEKSNEKKGSIKIFDE